MSESDEALRAIEAALARKRHPTVILAALHDLARRTRPGACRGLSAVHGDAAAMSSFWVLSGRAARGPRATGQRLSTAMQASWDMAAALAEINGVAGVLGDGWDTAPDGGGLRHPYRRFTSRLPLGAAPARLRPCPQASPGCAGRWPAPTVRSFRPAE